MEGVKGGCGCAHLQGLQIVVVGLEGRFKGSPLGLLPVLLRAPGILPGIGGGFKQIQAPQALQIQRRILRKLRDRDLRDHGSHQLPLKGVVIQKYHAVHSDVQGLLDGADIPGLILPVCHKHGEVLQPQHHLRMLLKGLLCGVLVVFAADRQEDPPVFQFLQPFLEIREGMAGTKLSDLDPAEAVVSDHTAPKGVVQIQHQAFFDRSLQ